MILRRHHVLCIFFLVLAVRIVAALNTFAIFSDGPEYVKVARWYLAGEYDNAIRHAYHPLCPLAVVAFYSVVGTWEVAGQAVSVIFSSLAVFPLLWLSRKFFEEKHVLTVGVFYAFCPYAATISAQVQTSGLYVGLFLFAAWAAIEAATTLRLRYFPLVGLFCALSYLVRVDGLVLVGGFALGMVVLFIRECLAKREPHASTGKRGHPSFVGSFPPACGGTRGGATVASTSPPQLFPQAGREQESPAEGSRGGAALTRGTGVPPVKNHGQDAHATGRSGRLWRLAAGSCLAAVVWFCVSSPYLLALRSATGKWKLTMKMSQDEISQMASAGAGEQGATQAETKEKMLASVGLMAMDFAEGAHYLTVFLLGVGLLQRRVRAKDRIALIILWAILAVNLLMLFRFGIVAGRMSRRYAVGLIALSLPWAVSGLAYLSTLAWRAIWRLKVARASCPCREDNGKANCTASIAKQPFMVNWQSVAVGLVLCVGILAPKTFATTAWNKQDEVEAARFIREKATVEPIRILTYLERVPFYADGEQAPLLSGGYTLVSVADYARTRGIEFICVDKNVSRIASQFYYEADKANVDLVFKSSRFSEGKNEVRVYRVK